MAPFYFRDIRNVPFNYDNKPCQYLAADTLTVFTSNSSENSTREKCVGNCVMTAGGAVR